MSVQSIHQVAGKAFYDKQIDGAALKASIAAHGLDDGARATLQHLQAEVQRGGMRADGDTIEVFSRHLAGPARAQPHASPFSWGPSPFMYGVADGAQAMAQGAAAAVQTAAPSVGRRALGFVKGALAGTVVGAVGLGLVLGGAVAALAGGDWGTGAGLFSAAVGAKIGFWGGGIYGAVKAKAPAQTPPAQ